MDWTPIRIPTPLFTQVTEILQNSPSKGYTNEHEFIREAVREKIAEVKKKEVNNPKEVETDG